MQSKIIDRRQAPSSKPLSRINFPTVEVSLLDNGIKVYHLQYGSEELVELKVSFPAGKSYQSEPGVANFASNMLQEGTRNYTGYEFAQKLDEFGAIMRLQSGFENSSVSLTTLTKHLDSTLTLLAEALLEPSFPEGEFVKMQKRTLENLDLEEQKTGYLARKHFNSLIYGKEHPYGRFMEKKDVQGLSLDKVKEYHREQYDITKAFIVAVGRFDEQKLLALLNKIFGSRPSSSQLPNRTSAASLHTPSGVKGLHYIEKLDSLQATLRVGHPAFSRNHEDYYPMQVVTTVFGGYFGSRLMKNIREEKGYTYGIGSAWLSMRYSGVFLIQTDVGNQYIDDTLHQIELELDRMLTEKVSEEEIQLVKNYMLGRSVSTRETPSQLTDIISNFVVNDVSFSQLDQKFDIIQGITPDTVLHLAQTYYHPDNLLKVVCGKMEKAPGQSS